MTNRYGAWSESAVTNADPDRPGCRAFGFPSVTLLARQEHGYRRLLARAAETGIGATLAPKGAQRRAQR